MKDRHSLPVEILADADCEPADEVTRVPVDLIQNQ